VGLLEARGRRGPVMSAATLADEARHLATSGHPVERAISAVREHIADLDAMAGDYYCAFPPTAEEREELIAIFSRVLRGAPS